MASYIESTLINDEKIIAKAHLSLWSMGLEIILGVLLSVLLVGLFLLLRVYLIGYFRKQTTPDRTGLSAKFIEKLV